MARAERATRGRGSAPRLLHLAAFHSITSSARATKVGGMAMPTALAVFRLMISSNLVGCTIGRSFAFQHAAGVDKLRVKSARCLSANWSHQTAGVDVGSERINSGDRITRV